MPTIYDNIEQHLLPALRHELGRSHRADFCVGYFHLRGWKALSDLIENWNGAEDNRCRLLVGMQKPPRDVAREFYAFRKTSPPAPSPNLGEGDLRGSGRIDNQTAILLKKRLAQEFREQLTYGLPTAADESGLRTLAQQLKTQKVVVKLFLRHPLHAKLYLCYRRDSYPILAYSGSSNLTLPGLQAQGELNLDVIDRDAAQKLARWFDDRWNDRWCLDISQELSEILETSWVTERPPYHIYLKMAYHLSQEARAGISEFQLPKDLAHELLDFQEKAVLIAARHLHKRGGVLVGDVVGLGKTITATAIARIFDDDFGLETLVLCPKNLTDMWEGYLHKYHLHGKVLSMSLVLRELPKLRRYRLIIIDESHNLRDREGKRYRAIQEYIALNDSKVILLTATPYNKTYLDLSNQLRLFLPEDHDLGISPERLIASLGGRVEFSAQYNVPVHSLAAFEKSLFADDWRELMRLYLVRRTRSFIKEYYAEADPATGRKFLRFADGRTSYFPERLPKKVEYPFRPDDPADQYARLYSPEVVDILNALHLPRYGLKNYLRELPPETPTKAEQIIMANLSRAGKRLMGFHRTTLFKRLESSGHAFLLSVQRHIQRNAIFLHALEHDLPLPIGEYDPDDLRMMLNDTDNVDLTGSGNDLTGFPEPVRSQPAQDLTGRRRPVRSENSIRGIFFKPELREHLLADSANLQRVLELGKDWQPEHDRKLNALVTLCAEHHPREKILIFTQYADTAVYLLDALQQRGVTPLACVTGASENPTVLAHRFSPRSNEQPQIVGTPEELRVLIATDVLSEGQNLQDAHIIVNYDLPWAIIRLIQRAGRVDRIGQTASQILCYSFLPEDGIERIIHLRDRLTQRIRENAEVVGSDETFFDGDPISLHDLYHEKSGILDDEDEGEVDLASYAFQIWKNATDADPRLLHIIPNLPHVVHGTKAYPTPDPSPKGEGSFPFPSERGQGVRSEGVIVYARTANENDVLAWVDAEGNLITQSQFAILKAALCAANTPAQPKLDNHHELVAKGLAYVQEIEQQIGGQLGKKSGARYRVYTRLTQYYDRDKDTLFANEELKRALDDIYNYPLREYARDALNRHLKTGVNDEQLANLVISLREDDQLCIVHEEEQERKEPQIICSMGLLLPQ